MAPSPPTDAGAAPAASTQDGPGPALRLHLLGRFEVLRDGVPIPAQAWRRRRPADLLKLVALAPGQRLGRDQVIDTLWPEKDPASGANNLHRALYDLRQVLGGKFVDVCCAVKEKEYETFLKVISSWEREHLLLTV